MSKRKLYRDARTGEFVPKTTVEASPDITVTETIESTSPMKDLISHARQMVDEWDDGLKVDVFMPGLKIILGRIEEGK
jgi:hypothetical protein